MDNYRPGGNYALCDKCGWKFRAYDLTKDWDGQLVCRADYDGRHPQDTVRGRKDNQIPEVSNPEGTDVFLGDNDVTRGSL